MTSLIKPMLAAHSVKFRVDRRLIAEPKADGYRMLARRTKDGWVFYTRNLNTEPYTSNLQFLAEQLPKLPLGTTLDGELAMDSFNEVGHWRREYMTEEDIRELAATTIWILFDIYDQTSKKGERLERRKKRLRKLVRETDNIMIAPEVLIRSEAHMMKIYNAAIANGWEGIVVKDLDDTYVPGVRRDAWGKMKALDTIDGKVIGFQEGKGADRGMLGSLLVEVDGRTVKVAGFTTAMKRNIWANRKKFLGKIVEFKVMKGSVRNPKFVAWRHDR